jgi:glycosyltransferase involved in cell wall biosynthesis
LIGWLLKQADVVIALSGEWQRFLLDEVRPDLRVVVLPNSVDAQFAAASEQDDTASRQAGKAVLFVGRLCQPKGVFDILHAAPAVLAAHPDAVFWFAGRAPEEQILEEMQRISKEMNLGSAVQFLGEITGQAKLDLFRQAALFVLPSYWEGLPYSLLEAMAVGLPVIATPVGAIPEMIEEGHHGFLIQPGDVAALAKRMIRLLEDQSLARQMGQANRDLIRDLYLPEAAMTRMVSIYAGLQKFHAPETSRPSPTAEGEGPGASRANLEAGSDSLK